MSENAQDLRKVTQRRRPPHGPGARMMPGEKAKDFKGTIAKLVRFMGQFKVSLAVAIVFAIFSAAFSIVGPKVLSQATTELFNGIVAKIGGTGGIIMLGRGNILAQRQGEQQRQEEQLQQLSHARQQGEGNSPKHEKTPS